MFVGSASLLPGGLGTTQYLVSPSALLAAPVLLGFLLCVLRAFEGTLVGARLWLAVVTAGLVGSKASHAVMGLVGLAAAVAATAGWEPRLRDRAVGLLVTTTLAFAGTHLALQAGGHTTLTIGWGQALTYTGLPSSPWLAPVSTVAFAVLFLGRDAGVLCALGEPPRAPTARVMVWFALGASACALWLALTLEHAGLGQVYFLQASHVVACPIAGWGGSRRSSRACPPGARSRRPLCSCASS